MLMLGLAIIAMLGSVLGYLLEPGRFQLRGQTEITRQELGADEPYAAKDDDRAPRRAA
jgi:hypothetical protein